VRLLKGVRVLDLGGYIAGPFTATLLADFGAEVSALHARKNACV
jgi:crotonobetainyl-CoA:carnitine CoA-transferase CaiB-like acyl-CoA transferase